MGAKRIYRGVSPYPQEAVREVNFAQTNDVLYLAHAGYAPRKLIRHGHTDWRFSTISWGPTIVPPVGASVSAQTPNNTGYVAKAYRYVVTAVRDDSPVQESRASAVIQTTNDLTLSGNTNTITVPAPSGSITRHIIYKEQAGSYGYIGATEGTSFIDNNIQPVLSETPPKGDNPFAAAGDYPGVVALHQQRTVWGATANVINGLYASRTADLENMDKARPARADDALAFALVAEKANGVADVVSMDELLVFTTDAIWAIQGGEAGVITPSAINPKRQLGQGSRKIKPLVVGKTVFYVPSKGQLIRALGYSFDIEGYKSNNVTIFSPHLFKRASILKMVFTEEPHACIWTLLSDGQILCFTWEEEQDVWGWTRIETEGFVEDIEVIAESGNDRLYGVIRRTINGVNRKFIERMALPHVNIEQAVHLDCSFTQVTAQPTSVITGLWHLEGAQVSVTFDGYAHHGVTVTEGRVTLPQEATARTISVGLRYTGEIETLPPALAGQGGTAHVNRQQIGEIVVRAIDTRGIEIGQAGGQLEQIEMLDGTEVAELPDVEAVDYRVTPESNWEDTASVRIEQNEPLPAHVVGIFYEPRVGPK